MEPSKTEKQKTAKAGASVDTWPKRWKEISHEVRRLQMRIAKASEGRQMGQGESPSVSADPLAFRQVIGGKAGDLEQGKEDPRRRWHPLEGCERQIAGSASLETTRLHTTTVTEDIHTKKTGRNAL
jgi:hypothetical protein